VISVARREAVAKQFSHRAQCVSETNEAVKIPFPIHYDGEAE